MTVNISVQLTASNTGNIADQIVISTESETVTVPFEATVEEK